LAAEMLGVPVDRIEVRQGDSDEVPQGGGTGGSRSIQTGGVAIGRAVNTLMAEAAGRAAKLLGCPVAVFDPVLGAFVSEDGSDACATWPEVVGAAGGPLVAENIYQAASATFPSGAYLAVVEVDTETGRTWLRRMFTVDDAGRILQPTLATGQVHGGVAQGVAQALFEEMRYDRDGQPLTGTFADYLPIGAGELPAMDTAFLSSVTEVNELSVKGIGESGSVGAPPAVLNAVVDAVSHLGVRHIDMPATPERVWRAISAATA
jgi:carbon-monoxide dehydrogenase large subunit